MIDRLGVHGLDERELIRDLRRVRQQFTHPCPGFTMARELELRGHYWKAGLRCGHAGQPLTHADGFGEILALEFH